MRNEIKYKRTEANDMVKVKSRHKGTNQSTHIEQKRLAINEMRSEDYGKRFFSIVIF